MFMGPIGLVLIYWFIFLLLCLPDSDWGCRLEGVPSPVLWASLCEHGMFGRAYWKPSGSGVTEKISNWFTQWLKINVGFLFYLALISIIFFSETVLVASKFSNILAPGCSWNIMSVFTSRAFVVACSPEYFFSSLLPLTFFFAS